MDDELTEAIDKADAGLIPSPFGRIEIVIPGAPASVQASKAVRDGYLSAIRTKLSRYQFILTGQIVLEITWLVPARSRYETDAKADIDNCLKPIIDAFAGPAGLFINDCQLKGLYICWRHAESSEEQLLFRFDFDAEQWSERKGLAFLRLERGLCVPVSILWPQALRRGWVELMRAGESFKEKTEAMGASYLALAGVTGGGQPFHVTRTIGFPVLSADDFVRGGES
ncbi:RusA family crossover junction endodeoxyribonuclease [Pseudoxanthomonas sp. PXM01]|uniref:RusA family crossover junction endodeoxyribonuclease n=1 Tax=Pseudoxanthomonas sp. PXM01 TaxID=2769295 RepID=UPI00178210D3|nr:RusA family crossover junction endodeoxyribonuclease [Pseudoxanthomonas sp. PXM01]MBD9471240.1 RusA family crossover junction endodeoxyribonuclease [Pseudoxanthomonas sp. PXM01]